LRRLAKGLLVLSGLLFCVSSTSAQTEKLSDADRKEFLGWTKPVKPYRIIGNVYYVGSNELTSFLIATPKGHILIDAGMEEMAPQIAENMERLGFHPADVKILLNTQAHIDHAAGLAELKRISGARLLVSRADASVIESGGAADYLWPDRFRWEPVKVDGFVEDGQTIELGGVTLTAHLTPGHTKGCTTYTMTVESGGRDYHIVFLGSTTLVGQKLIGNEGYPQIVGDFQRTFQVLKSLQCDVFLASHASFYKGLEKGERLRQGIKANPFVDRKEFRTFVEEQEKNFEAELQKQKKPAT
jgi:metallo-beta-lactamase class B